MTGHRKVDCSRIAGGGSDAEVAALTALIARLSAAPRHGASSPGLTIEDLDDPVDTGGHWISLEDFVGRKSFGAFKCKCCSGKTWVSAHAYADFKQACKSCNVYTLPKFMWVNDPSDDSESRTVKKLDADKPHDMARCEACAAGVCSASTSSLRF